MSSITALSEVQSVQEFSKMITQSPPSACLDEASLSAIHTTLSLLYASSSNQLGFLPASQTLVASSPSSAMKCTSPEAQTFLSDLTRAANVLGMTLACSSVLAGLSSESDAYGDVGLWLGEVSLKDTKEQQIVSLLGLRDWLQHGGRIVSVETSSHALPVGLAQLSVLQRNAVRGPLDEFTSLIAKLEQRFEFRLESAGHGGRVIFFLIGKILLDGQHTWVGLVGAGIWAVEDE